MSNLIGKGEIESLYIGNFNYLLIKDKNGSALWAADNHSPISCCITYELKTGKTQKVRISETLILSFDNSDNESGTQYEEKPFLERFKARFYEKRS